MRYKLVVFNVGQPAKVVRVSDADGTKRDAAFSNEDDAFEAANIIATMRIDTAFLKVQVEPII